MNKNLSLFTLIFAILLITWCTEKEPEIIQESTQIANPASIYCEENGWKLEIRKNNEWEFWMCKFDDGSECEERDFFNWECLPLEKS